MISAKEKIAYGLGDTASNIVFQTVMLFLSYFYTDIFGISPAVVGTLFLTVRIFDAVTDPLMGALTDRTMTKYGKFRPYVLWLAVPFGIISVLAFTTPDLSDTGKIIYAFVTYALLMAVYTAINIPYCALGGSLTADADQRVSIQSYRFVFGMLGGLIVALFTLPLVDFFGDGDRAKGYQLTMAAMSVFGVILFLLCFAGTKERVFPPKEQSSSIREDLISLFKNDQWRILSVVAALVLTGMVMRSTLAIYYVKDFLGREDLITAFITVAMIGNIAGCSLSNMVSKRFCKIKAYIVIHLIAGLICGASYFIQPDMLYLAFAAFFVWSFILQIGTPILWSAMADLVDYGHWKSGVRINGVTFSTVIFFIKLGAAVGGAIAGWLLAYYGYQANVEMSDTTREGILFAFTIVPLIPFMGVALIMRFYKLTESKVKEIQHALASANA